MTITARHALVTGGSRGIGRAIALKLADHGVHVAINYLKDERSAQATLEVLCRYFAVALAPRGITVNAISPGWTVDSVFNTLPEPVQQMIRDRQDEGWTPMRRLGTPPDIANAVTLFCSKEAAWITGQV